MDCAVQEAVSTSGVGFACPYDSCVQMKLVTLQQGHCKTRRGGLSFPDSVSKEISSGHFFFVLFDLLGYLGKSCKLPPV